MGSQEEMAPWKPGQERVLRSAVGNKQGMTFYLKLFQWPVASVKGRPCQKPWLTGGRDWK